MHDKSDMHKSIIKFRHFLNVACAAIIGAAIIITQVKTLKNFDFSECNSFPYTSLKLHSL